MIISTSFKKNSMNIFIKKLSYDTTEATLRAAFEKFGTVENCNIVMDKVSRKSKGFGFVEMLDDNEANNAIAALNNSKLDGRAIAAKETGPK
jgi:RNA recognition motif-containing protein